MSKRDEAIQRHIEAGGVWPIPIPPVKRWRDTGRWERLPDRYRACDR